MIGSRLLHDVRFAWRSALNAPGTTFVIVLTLAVAIGANTAIFSVVESVLLQPLPYPDEERIVRAAYEAGRRVWAQALQANPVVVPRLPRPT